MTEAASNNPSDNVGDNSLAHLHSSSSTGRSSTTRAVSANVKLAEHVAAWMQVGFVIAIFVLWQMMRWPFARAAEVCIVAGVLVYSVINIGAAVSAAWSGPKLAARVSRLAAVIMFLLMRQVYHKSLLQCIFVFIVLWLIVPLLLRHSRRRAISAGPVKLNRIPS